MAANMKTVPTVEYDAAIAAADRYVEALRVGSSADLSAAFHKDAIMYGYISPPGPEMLTGSIRNLVTYVDKFGAAPDIKARSDILSITPTTAVVRTDMENDGSGSDYTDFLNLVKMDGKWTIIAKTFHKYG